MQEANEIAVTQPPTKPEPKPILLTLEQCKLHRPALERKLCYIVNIEGLPSERYFMEPGCGGTGDLSQATRWSAWEALAYHGTRKTHLMIQLVDQELAGALEKKKCCIESVLEAAVVELLKLAPMNPQARAHVLAVMGKKPPEEAKTYEEVKDWIESNGPIVPVMSAVSAATPAAIRYQTLQDIHHAQMAGRAVRQSLVAFKLVAEFSQLEVGTCRYRDRQSGREERPVTREEIQEILDAHPDYSLPEITEALCSKIEQTLWELNPEMSSNDGPDYGDGDSDETRDHESDIQGGRGHIQNLLRDYLRCTLSAEEQTRRGV